MPLFLALLFLALPHAARERAVMIYPREHTWFRRVFYTAHQRGLQRQLRARFDLDVHEQVGTANDLFGIDLHGANVLVLSGHGCPFAISLDGRDAVTLSPSNAERLRAFLSELAPDATIILQSCYTGRFFANVVKRAAGPGRHVIAADGDVPRDGMSIISLDPLEVTITCRDEGRKQHDCTVRF